MGHEYYTRQGLGILGSDGIGSLYRALGPQNPSFGRSRPIVAQGDIPRTLGNGGLAHRIRASHCDCLENHAEWFAGRAVLSYWNNSTGHSLSCRREYSSGGHRYEQRRPHLVAVLDHARTLFVQYRVCRPSGRSLSIHSPALVCTYCTFIKVTIVHTLFSPFNSTSSCGYCCP